MPDMRVVQVPCPHGDFELVERPIPEPHAGQVLIKIEVCGICYGDAVAKRPFRKGLNG
jgi:D-arabinose 1-dehydrogenase-like Zn-dependent alcohol dehydrogenase